MRVLKGGSSYANYSGVRCALRSRIYPYYGLRDVGFRAVAVPQNAFETLNSEASEL